MGDAGSMWQKESPGRHVRHALAAKPIQKEALGKGKNERGWT